MMLDGCLDDPHAHGVKCTESCMCSTTTTEEPREFIRPPAKLAFKVCSNGPQGPGSVRLLQ